MSNRQGQILLITSILISLIILVSVSSWPENIVIRIKSHSKEFILQQGASIALEAIAYASREEIRRGISFSKLAREYFLWLLDNLSNEPKSKVPFVHFIKAGKSNRIANNVIVVAYECVLKIENQTVVYRSKLTAITKDGFLLIKCIHEGPLMNYKARIQLVKGGLLVYRAKLGAYYVKPYTNKLLIVDEFGVFYTISLPLNYNYKGTLNLLQRYFN